MVELLWVKTRIQSTVSIIPRVPLQPSAGGRYHKTCRPTSCSAYSLVYFRSQVDEDPKFVGPHICVPIIVYLDKTTLDGLGRTSAFPLYISTANFSWKVYNDKSGMQLCALLPCPVADADWKQPGWKPKSEGFKETKRYFMNWCLSIIFESARQASFTGFTFQDPKGVDRKAVPFIFVISKDLGEASAISSVRASACDSCLVPSEDLPSLKEACVHGFPTRREDDMWLVLQQMHDFREAGAPKARILELVKEHGIHYQEVSRHSHFAHEFTHITVMDGC